VFTQALVTLGVEPRPLKLTNVPEGQVHQPVTKSVKLCVLLQVPPKIRSLDMQLVKSPDEVYPEGQGVQLLDPLVFE
jgi:hypothetical protein